MGGNFDPGVSKVFVPRDVSPLFKSVPPFKAGFVVDGNFDPWVSRVFPPRVGGDEMDGDGVTGDFFVVSVVVALSNVVVPFIPWVCPLSCSFFRPGDEVVLSTVLFWSP